LYQLSSVPASLFGDEIDVGYHAYSILKTGRDYSGNFMPLHFHSLAEWRTPLYLYSTVPTVAVFGVTPLGVRLPAAIFGALSVLAFYLLVKLITKAQRLATVASVLMAINPWSLQYSRAGFEVTMLLAFLLFGLYFFYKSFERPRLLWISIVLLLVTPLIYSTAKFFTPFLLVFLFFTYRKDLLKVPKKYLSFTFLAFLLFGLLTSYAVLFSGGAQRFSYIGVFTDPVIEPEVGVDRLRDGQMRGENGVGLQPKLTDRLIHNKFTYVGENVVNNFISSLSFDFLFVNGDPNPRHMMDGMGMFFKPEFIALILGLVYFFKSKDVDPKHKKLILFWITAGIIPSALTRDGGNHATRLFLILPPLILLISYGVVEIFQLNKLLFLTYLSFLFLSFAFYIHNYYVHYPWDSERWWHAGWCEAVNEVKKIDTDYDRVIITMADEPAWTFFAGCYQYNPELWQTENPIGNDVELMGFGKVSHTGKFYFGKPDGSIYALKDSITSKDIYLASAKEIPWNLIQEPTRVPDGLSLLKAIAFPSGEPAFYILTKGE
jgi:4-amino-4-deoxy-L-arabinose transferase-like glycosyltransferase